jgi:hypothetical protein
MDPVLQDARPIFALWAPMSGGVRIGRGLTAETPIVVVNTTITCYGCLANVA